MAEFSLALNDDQVQIKDWVHEFAANVVRPAAEEWDEREEFPWPIVQEAAKIGLYSFDFMAQAMPASRSWARAWPRPASPATAPPSR